VQVDVAVSGTPARVALSIDDAQLGDLDAGGHRLATLARPARDVASRAAYDDAP